MKKKILFLCLLFLLSCAKKEIVPTDVPVTKDDEKVTNVEGANSDENLTEEEKINRTLLNGVLRGEKEINVTEFNIPEEKAKQIFSDFLWNYPLLFHLKRGNSFGYRTQSEQGKTHLLEVLMPPYALMPEHIKDVYPILENKLEEYYSHLDKNMKDEEIAYTMQKLICQNTVYGQQIEGENYHSYNAFSALGPFINNKAVCQGYSLSFALLMNGLGVTTDYVTGHYPKTSGHMWNRILIDDQWYNVDPTFDDANILKISKEGSRNAHFLSSDELFYQKLEHARPHSNLRERIFTPSGNRFDSPNVAFRWFDSEKGMIRTEPEYVNGHWYYLSFEEENIRIIKSDFEGKNKKIIRENNIRSIVSGNVTNVYYGKDRIYFVDLIDSKYYICSVDYEGNHFTKGNRGYAYYETITNDWFVINDSSKPNNDFSGIVALRAELALAKMRDTYSHGQEDYFKPQDPTRIELRKAIREAEGFLKSNAKDDSRADALSIRLRGIRSNYSLPISAD